MKDLTTLSIVTTITTPTSITILEASELLGDRFAWVATAYFNIVDVASDTTLMSNLLAGLMADTTEHDNNCAFCACKDCQMEALCEREEQDFVFEGIAEPPRAPDFTDFLKLDEPFANFSFNQTITPKPSRVYH